MGGVGNVEVRDEVIRIGAIELYLLQVRVLFELADESPQLQHGFWAEHVDRRVIESRTPVGRGDLGQFELGLVNSQWGSPWIQPLATVAPPPHPITPRVLHNQTHSPTYHP